MAGNNRKYNLTISPLWNQRNNSGMYGLIVNDEVMDALQAVEKGGRLVIKALKEESRKGEKSPHAYLEYVSKDEVAAYTASKAAPSDDGI